MKYNLPQNTVLVEPSQQTRDGFYELGPEETQIFVFSVPPKKYIKLGIAIISVDCEDLSMTGWFSRKPLDIPMFPYHSGLNPFYVRKNYSYDEMYAGSNGTKLTIYDKDYVTPFPDGVTDYRLQAGGDIIDATLQYSGNTPSQPSMRPLIDKTQELVIDNNQEFYFFNVRNLQNKAKSFRLLTSTTQPDCDPHQDLDSHTNATNEYIKKNVGDFASSFRYPSQNRPTF